MYLENWNSGTSYQVRGPVYENPETKIWCGYTSDNQGRDAFVKVLFYGQLDNNQLAQTLHQNAVEEARNLRLAAKCTNGVPKLIDSWDDKG